MPTPMSQSSAIYNAAATMKRTTTARDHKVSVGSRRHARAAPKKVVTSATACQMSAPPGKTPSQAGKT